MGTGCACAEHAYGHGTSSSCHLTSGDVTSGSTTSHHISSESGHYGAIDLYAKPFSPPDPSEITLLQAHLSQSIMKMPNILFIGNL
jgi:hypothetical protein